MFKQIISFALLLTQFYCCIGLQFNTYEAADQIVQARCQNWEDYYRFGVKDGNFQTLFQTERSRIIINGEPLVFEELHKQYTNMADVVTKIKVRCYVRDFNQNSVSYELIYYEEWTNGESGIGRSNAISTFDDNGKIIDEAWTVNLEDWSKFQKAIKDHFAKKET